MKNFLFSTSSKLALGPTHLPIQLVPGTGGALYAGIKWPGREEANHSFPTNVRGELIRGSIHLPSIRLNLAQGWITLLLPYPNTATVNTKICNIVPS
jgi:hypothetical protein